MPRESRIVHRTVYVAHLEFGGEAARIDLGCKRFDAITLERMELLSLAGQ
jgi:hypothetical protein